MSAEDVSVEADLAALSESQSPSIYEEERDADKINYSKEEEKEEEVTNHTNERDNINHSSGAGDIVDDDLDSIEDEDSGLDDTESDEDEEETLEMLELELKV